MTTLPVAVDQINNFKLAGVVFARVGIVAVVVAVVVCLQKLESFEESPPAFIYGCRIASVLTVKLIDHRRIGIAEV